MASSSESENDEEIATHGLVATRRKRATAGNLYATLRQNLDDEELQRELMADEEDDEGSYEGSDKDDDDAAMEESSSDDDDAGPAKEGDKEDLSGEKELQRQERAQARKKRKFDEARMRLPAWQKAKKKVRLAEDAVEEVTRPKPKKKSERSNWLPTAADAPSRQSTRASAVANREHVHENLKQSTMRSENQKKIMKDHQRRLKEKERRVLTQEERMGRAARVEKETMRDFGRWEREEREKQRLREEAAAAKRRRVIEGPVVRWWSGSVLWEGEEIVVKRMPKKEVVEVEVEGGEKAAETTAEKAEEKPEEKVEATAPPPATTGATSSTPTAPPTSDPDPQPPWLAGIHDYASGQQPSTPTAPAFNTTQPTPTQSAVANTAQPPVYRGWPPAPTQQPPPPLIEQAQRTLLILDQFPSLDPPPPTRRTTKTTKDSTASTTPLTEILLPTSFPPLTPSESHYLTSHKLRKRPSSKTSSNPGEMIFHLPPRPEKTRCSLTGWVAKYRDPETGLSYAGRSEWGMVRRLVGGGCAWSGLVGGWVGPRYSNGKEGGGGQGGGFKGRAARGVVEGFEG